MPEDPSTRRILDVGTTDFTFFLKRCQPDSEVHTIDLTDEMLPACTRAGVLFHKCNLETQVIPSADDYFDFIAFGEVLEHLFTPPTRVLAELRRVLSPSGILVITVPNIVSLMNRIRVLAGASPLPDPDYQLRPGMHGHIHEYTMGELVSLLNRLGFRIVGKRYIMPGEPRSRGIRKLFAWAYYGAVWLVPQFRPFIFVEVRKVTGYTGAASS